MRVGTMMPILARVAVRVRERFLRSGIVTLVIRDAVRSFLSLLNGEIRNVAGIANDSNYLHGLRRSLVTRACVAAPSNVREVEVNYMDGERAVLRGISVNEERTCLGLAEAVHANYVRRRVAVALFLDA